ncbi:MAG: hypothetical protein HY721_33325 [Planctomycetes bacterium]|nr:hypothetical protein [Planctomycetota bacterium]
MKTPVQENNLVSIPQDIVRELNIHPGTLLELDKAGGGAILVKPVPNRGEMAGRLLGAGRHLLKAGSDPIGDLVSEREGDDELDQLDDVR